MPPPQLSAEQKAAALVKSVANRRARAALKVSMKAGEISLAEVLERVGRDEIAGRMRIQAALAALPHIGAARAAAALRELRIAPERTLRQLGRAQRQELLAWFAGIGAVGHGRT